MGKNFNQKFQIYLQTNCCEKTLTQKFKLHHSSQRNHNYEKISWVTKYFSRFPTPFSIIKLEKSPLREITKQPILFGSNKSTRS